MEHKIRVLFLPKWYPHRYDPMPGLFIQRQAESLVPFCDVAVIYVHPDPDCPNRYEVDFSEENQVRVLRVYFRTGVRSFPLPEKWMNMIQYYRAHMKAYKSIRQFSPQIVHAHILTRMGWIGWRIGRKYHIPLIISEHWSRYFPENRIWRKGFHHWATRFVTSRSKALVPVSEMLKTAMKNVGLKHGFMPVVPNVVEPGPPLCPTGFSGEKKKTILHVSCFEDKSKNISQFLWAIQKLGLAREDFTCFLVGDGPDFPMAQEYARELGILGTFVNFTGLKTGAEVFGLMYKADFLVLSSRYETFGTVVPEALSCGIPVVATRVGIVPEVINETNGIVVPPGDGQALMDAMNQMLDRCRQYNREQIRAGIGNTYSKEVVGRKIYDIYQKILSQSRK